MTIPYNTFTSYLVQPLLELFFNQKLDNDRKSPPFKPMGEGICLHSGKFILYAEKAKILDISEDKNGFSLIKWKSRPRTEVKFDGVHLKEVREVEQNVKEAPMIDLSIYSLWSTKQVGNI